MCLFLGVGRADSTGSFQPPPYSLGFPQHPVRIQPGDDSRTPLFPTVKVDHRVPPSSPGDVGRIVAAAGVEGGRTVVVPPSDLSPTAWAVAPPVAASTTGTSRLRRSLICSIACGQSEHPRHIRVGSARTSGCDRRSSVARAGIRGSKADRCPCVSATGHASCRSASPPRDFVQAVELSAVGSPRTRCTGYSSSYARRGGLRTRCICSWLGRCPTRG